MPSSDDSVSGLRQGSDPVRAPSALKKRLRLMSGEGAPTSPASERLAQLRQARSLRARLQLRWRVLPSALRGAVAILGLATGAIAMSGVAWAVSRSGGRQAVARPALPVIHVSRVPTSGCYGSGAELGGAVADKIEVAFDYPVIARKALATLSFTSRHLTSDTAVEISVGAAHQAFVEPAGLGSVHRQEVRLASRDLRPNETNLIVFENRQRPIARGPWAICGIAVRVEQLPDGTPADLEEQANEEICRGDRAYEDRGIEAANLSRACTAYHRGLLYLEAQDPRPDEYALIRDRVRDCRRELDSVCGRLEMRAEALQKQQRFSEAIAELTQGLRYFPGSDDACAAELRHRLEALQ